MRQRIQSKSESQQGLHDAQARYLRHAVENDPQKRTLSAIAQAGGLHHTTLTQFLKNGSTRILDALTLVRVGEVTGLRPPPELVGGAIGGAAPGLAEETETYLTDEDAQADQALRTLIGGRNGVDAMTLKTRALELAGYAPGDIVVVDLNATPRHGDAVFAQIVDWESGAARTVVRRFEVAGAVNLLVARTLDPALQETFVVDGRSVFVKGVITDMLRRAPRAA